MVSSSEIQGLNYGAPLLGLARSILYKFTVVYCESVNLIGYITVDYINNSLHLARKYARIFVLGHYLFREANSFPRAKLEENCELRGTDNVQGQISEHIFAAKLRPLCLLSIGFKNWGISSDIPQF